MYSTLIANKVMLPVSAQCYLLDSMCVQGAGDQSSGGKVNPILLALCMRATAHAASISCNSAALAPRTEFGILEYTSVSTTGATIRRFENALKLACKGSGYSDQSSSLLIHT